MALKLFGRTGVTSPKRETRDGEDIPIRVLRDGTLSVVQFAQIMSLEGRVFIANFGTEGTPVALQTAYDADRPSLNVDVPDGIVAVPLYFEIQVAATGAVQFDGKLMVSPVIVGLGTSAAAYTAITTLNANLGSTNTSGCQARHTFTANGATPEGSARWLSHFSSAADIDAAGSNPSHFEWNASKGLFIPVVADGGSINAYFYNGTSATAYAVLAWAELTNSDIKNL